ncbi:MAG: ABC transporter permease subunit/CPBP intramembrane protease [Phycisphaerae bacterium]
MSMPRRIRTVYFKELIDILRDHRTLVAMIVVPIVLYPLLMLGSIQAVSFQAEALDREPLLIGTVGKEQQKLLARLIEEDARFTPAPTRPLRNNNDETDGDPVTELIPTIDGGAEEASREQVPRTLTDSRLAIAETETDLRLAVQEREIHVGIVFDANPNVFDTESSIPIRVFADLEEVRSRSAHYRLTAMIKRIGERRRDRALEDLGLPLTLVRPFAAEVVDLSSPPSILGQVLPLILILMTITGAIYPAIDLTAGERERGTLESLMACPVPVIDLIVGKFLVVTTVAVMGAALNLASVSATVYFGGFDRVLAETGGVVPIGTMLLILVSLVPFAVLMSAIMIAVCSYARTFKEAQNYVTPVILAVLIPGGIAALPAARAEGLMLVMPVGNMVLLTRDLLLGSQVPLSQLALALCSTTLYAGAAVAVAAGIFGKESVVFADSGSLAGVFRRQFIKPRQLPPLSMVLLYVSLLFPTWFFIQSAISPTDMDEGSTGVLKGTAAIMPILFILLPFVMLRYWKINVWETFGFQIPPLRYQVAGIIIGLTAWIPAAEITVLQAKLFGLPAGILAQNQYLLDALRALPLLQALFFTAVVPAISEEILFRGLLLNGLRTGLKRNAAIITCGVIFGVFHFLIFRFAITATLGIVLAYLAWQSRSIVPAIMAHLLHNGLATYRGLHPEQFEWLTGPVSDDPTALGHLPLLVIGVGMAILLAGILLASQDAGGAAESADA